MNVEKVDALLRRHIYNLRYGHGLAARSIKSISHEDDKILAWLTSWSAGLTDSEREAVIALTRGHTAGGVLRKAISDYVDAQVHRLNETYHEELLLFIASTAAHTVRTLSTPESPSVNVSARKVYRDPILGRVIPDEWKQIFARWKAQVISEVVLALDERVDPGVKIKGTRTQRYKDGWLYTRNNSIDRTIVTQTAGAAANTRTRIYSELFDNELEDWLATLDHKTCIRCATAEEQGPYPVDAGPREPLHPYCRCLRVPEGLVTERPFVDDARSVKDIPKSERPGKIGKTKLGYKEFFNRQNAEAKRDILGPARHDLWKTGEYEITDYVNDVSLAIYNLEDLDRLH